MENEVFKMQYTNIFSETMTLTLDIHGDMWFEHEDCNKEPEDINKLTDQTTGAFKYILHNEERITLQSFMIMADNMKQKLDEHRQHKGVTA